MSDYIPAFAMLTGGIELFAAIYFSLLFKNKERGIKGLILILFFLSGYQILEAINCMGYGNPLMVRLAFADITWLPALGVYTAYVMKPKKGIVLKTTKNVLFLSAIFFSAWFISDPSTAILKSCQSFFATYGNSYPIYNYYGLYYQVGMFLMVAVTTKAMVETESKRDRALMADYILGSVMFIIPSLAVTVAFEAFQGSMPSVMCHIALFLSVFIIKALLKEKAEDGLSIKDASPIFNKTL